MWTRANGKLGLQKLKTAKIIFYNETEAENMSLSDESGGLDIRFDESDEEEIPGRPMMGDFVLVKFATKKTLVHYVARNFVQFHF
ncbi:hypothetical protein FQA39_LY02739 [Lamprigera yunnana]|nr:hypothetical protein FQA39_LY02739 [Lamprigera yunnana]